MTQILFLTVYRKEKMIRRKSTRILTVAGYLLESEGTGNLKFILYYLDFPNFSHEQFLFTKLQMLLRK